MQTSAVVVAAAFATAAVVVVVVVEVVTVASALALDTVGETAISPQHLCTGPAVGTGKEAGSFGLAPEIVGVAEVAAVAAAEEAAVVAAVVEPAVPAAAAAAEPSRTAVGRHKPCQWQGPHTAARNHRRPRAARAVPLQGRSLRYRSRRK